MRTRLLISRILFSASICILAGIPAVRGWHAFTQQIAIQTYQASFSENMAATDKENEAVRYNNELYRTGHNHILEYGIRATENSRVLDYGRACDPKYENLLCITDDGMMGYLEIPSIGVSLPVFHYASEPSLEKGVGHMYGSSLPVGGKNTHCVLTGHRGIPNATLFTDLDQMKAGDIFILHVLGRDLYYQTDQIKTVLPDDADDLSLCRGADYVTLLTCTPYGVNTHRLLVRGHRVAGKTYLTSVSKERSEELKKYIQSWQTSVSAGVFAIFMGSFLFIFIWKDVCNPMKGDGTDDT